MRDAGPALATGDADRVAAAVAELLDRIGPDPAARAAAGRELARLAGRPGARPPDPWASRARPSFLYVMYALLLWAIPLGVLAAFRPDTARAVAAGMTAYLAGIPEPLYALFGTGYLGYTVAREWGKAKGG